MSTDRKGQIQYQDENSSDRMFLTAREVGHQLGVRRSRVYELAASGAIPVVRIGRRMLFPRRGLEELADIAIDQLKARMNGT